MIKMRLLVVGILALAAPVSAQQGGAILLSAVSGSVELQTAPDQTWAGASAGAELREGFSLRTGPDGRAQISFPDKAVVWVKESSTFGLKSTLPLTRKIELTGGEIKVSVPHLKRKQTFEVHTTNAVAAVRGTLFTVKTDDKGGIEVKVAYGEVKLHLLADAKTFSIPQGNSFRREEGIEATVVLMNKDQEREILLDWSPGISFEERSAGQIQKTESRMSMAAFARQTDIQQAAIAGLVQQTKDEDFAAGRTLVDVHGNLTRVDQRLLRPAADTLQFINLVKRPAYTYQDHGPAKPWTNSQGSVVNRLDSMQGFITFSEKLPQDLVEWPSFFKDNAVAMKSADLVMTSQYGASKILVLGSFGTNCSNADLSGFAATNCAAVGKTGQDTIVRGLYVGTVDTLAESQEITKLREVNEGPSGINYKVDGKDDGVLFKHRAETMESGGTHFWMTTESYVINNSGEIQTADSLVSSGKDPFTLLKETAGQVIISFKNTTGGPAARDLAGNPNIFKTGDVNVDDVNLAGFDARGRNIDLVVVPDLAVAIVQKLSSALSDTNSN